MTEYIEREKALSFPFANDQYDHVHADPHFIAGCETYKEWLSIIPAADVVEVRHGNWIPNSSNTRWICSECGIDDNYAYNYSGVNFSLKLQDFYCPNCGAKMDGGQDDV